MATVSRFSLIRVVGRRYSVPSRLIGHRLRVRVFAGTIEVEYQGGCIGRYPRLSGPDTYHIDSRHLVHSLVRKPGAFRSDVHREALFPTLTFRRCYDVLCERSTQWADLEYERVKAKLGPAPEIPAPEVYLAPPDLVLYDALIEDEKVAE
jgi:hypothetical protein